MSHSTAKPKCPGCDQTVVTSSKAQCVVCQRCSKDKRRVYRFCWDCQREWTGNTSPDSTCSQPNCALRAALLSDKRISDPNSSANGCPYFRACPKCNALLTHNGRGCPKINCPACGTMLCFRCLRPRCFRIDMIPVTHRDLNFLGLMRDMHRLEGFESCTIVENSQSLMALH